jgi:hypothetical protein
VAALEAEASQLRGARERLEAQVEEEAAARRRADDGRARAEAERARLQRGRDQLALVLRVRTLKMILELRLRPVAWTYKHGVSEWKRGCMAKTRPEPDRDSGGSCVQVTLSDRQSVLPSDSVPIMRAGQTCLKGCSTCGRMFQGRA